MSLNADAARAKRPRGRVFVLNKPYGVLSQFDGRRGDRTLAAFGLPKTARVAGRLDKDSEGLLLLAEDGLWAHRLMTPDAAHRRTYWALVEPAPDAEALRRLRDGVSLKDGPACAAAAQAIPTPPLPDRDPPVRPRDAARAGWIAVTLTEGRNRQVRRMCAAIDTPVLRLFRAAIGGFAPAYDDPAPGAWRALSAAEVSHLLD